jgi:hypothetical protein
MDQLPAIGRGPPAPRTSAFEIRFPATRIAPECRSTRFDSGDDSGEDGGVRSVYRLKLFWRRSAA